MTNRDKLNGMSNKELAEFLDEKNTCGMCSNSYYDEELEMRVCKNLNMNCSEFIRQWLEQWLEQEVET